MKKIFFVGVFLLFVLSACTQKNVMSVEDIKVAVADFINANLMQPGQQVSIKEVIDDGDLYKVVVNMPSGQEIESYITKDGAKFFPQAMVIAEVEAKNQENDSSQESSPVKDLSSIPKEEKPNVELFVMSHCPYGTQTEKGIIPVVKALGEKIDFKVKFVDYSMHGEKEIDEQLRQYCVENEQGDKYLAYLECFLQDDNSDRCLSEVGVNTASMNACVAKTDKEFSIKEKFADKSTWLNGNYPQFNIYKEENDKYGVKGSPTLVVNGMQISSGRDSDSLLKTICAGFENEAEECKVALSSTPPSPGFGFEGEGSATDASCN